MNILFLGGLYPDQLISEIKRNTVNGFQYAANTFQWALINGLIATNKASITICSMPFIGYFPTHYKRLKIREIDIYEASAMNRLLSLGFYNVPIYKDFYRYFRTKREIKTWGLNKPNNKVILVYSADLPFLKAAIAAKSIEKDIHVCVIVTDFPVIRKTLNIIKLLAKWIDKVYTYRYLKLVDSYVFLTKAWTDILQLNDKPYVVVEGIYNDCEANSIVTKKDNKKVILYAGNLDLRFGIKDLLTAFSLIENKDYELWICGDGLGTTMVHEFQRKDSRIKYLGLLDRRIVLELQKEATVLINPRPNEGDYTKYSFPSKTMEYLASGTPLIMKKLTGVPEEYYKYCFTIEGNLPHDIADKIIEICNMPNDKSALFGNEARKFILENKTSIKQATKIVDMLSISLSSIKD